MISFLFWNVYDRHLEDRVARLAVARNVDVVMLAESATSPVQMLEALNRDGDRRYTYPFTEGDRIQIFTRFPESSLIDFFNSPLNRLTIRRLRVRPTLDILLCVLHFQSRTN